MIERKRTAEMKRIGRMRWMVSGLDWFDILVVRWIGFSFLFLCCVDSFLVLIYIFMFLPCVINFPSPSKMRS